MFPLQPSSFASPSEFLPISRRNVIAHFLHGCLFVWCPILEHGVFVSLITLCALTHHQIHGAELIGIDQMWALSISLIADEEGLTGLFANFKTTAGNSNNTL